MMLPDLLCDHRFPNFALGISHEHTLQNRLHVKIQSKIFFFKVEMDYLVKLIKLVKPLYFLMGLRKPIDHFFISPSQ